MSVNEEYRYRIQFDTSRDRKDKFDAIPQGTRKLVMNGLLKALLDHMEQHSWEFMQEIMEGNIELVVRKEKGKCPSTT